MKHEVQLLYDRTIKNKKYEDSINEFIQKDNNFLTWRKNLYNIEKNIGGIGIHNVNKFFYYKNDNDNHITGNYILDDRPIFRPIQYIASTFFQYFILIDTRYLIDNSCAHIESLLKRILLKTKDIDCDSRPMGAIINALSRLKKFDTYDGKTLLENSSIINSIYRKSKHDFDIPDEENIDSLDLKTHLHSYEESIQIYFGCRIHGVSLMDWMNSINLVPESYKNLSEPNFDEYEKITDILKPNLNYFYPGFAEGGRKWLEKNWDIE